MRILITNDDGIHAPGLQSAEKIARQLSDDVWIVAPETDQSGVSHSLTLSHPLRVRKLSDKHYAVNGTPTDCVITGISELMEGVPDVVLSGVNSGQNIADDVIYSGTVAGAIEGCLMGVPSIALSQAYSFADGIRTVKWETCEQLAPEIVSKLIGQKFPAKTLVNINFPDCLPEAVQGVEVTGQGSFNHGLFLEKRYDGRGYPYYWIRFGREVTDDGEHTDIYAIRNNTVSISPLKLDLTCAAFKEELNKLF